MGILKSNLRKGVQKGVFKGGVLVEGRGVIPFESVEPTNMTARQKWPRSEGGEERHCDGQASSDEATSSE